MTTQVPVILVRGVDYNIQRGIALTRTLGFHLITEERLISPGEGLPLSPAVMYGTHYLNNPGLYPPLTEEVSSLPMQISCVLFVQSVTREMDPLLAVEEKNLITADLVERRLFFPRLRYLVVALSGTQNHLEIAHLASSDPAMTPSEEYYIKLQAAQLAYTSGHRRAQLTGPIEVQDIDKLRALITTTINATPV